MRCKAMASPADACGGDRAADRCGSGSSSVPRGWRLLRQRHHTMIGAAEPERAAIRSVSGGISRRETAHGVLAGHLRGLNAQRLQGVVGAWHQQRAGGRRHAVNRQRLVGRRALSPSRTAGKRKGQRSQCQSQWPVEPVSDDGGHGAAPTLATATEARPAQEGAKRKLCQRQCASGHDAASSRRVLATIVPRIHGSFLC
jgi:hypothetical protein